MSAWDASPVAGIDWDAIAARPPFAIDAAATRDRVAGRTVLVTGAGGSLGRALAEALARAAPARLVLLDQHESSLFHLRQMLTSQFRALPLRTVLGDVRRERSLRRLFLEERPDLVVHLAAYKQVPWGETEPEAFAEANVLGARAVIGAATAAGADQIVYPSTDKAIDPPSLYGATKRVVEAMLFAAAARGGPRCTVVRFVNVLGSQGSATETFARQIRAGEPLSVTDMRMRRYWITPGHATVLLAHAACLREQALVVAPNAGDEITVVDLARRLYWQLQPGRGDPAITITAARPGERLAEPLTAPHETLEPLPLAGLLAVRGAAPVNPLLVDEIVAEVARLLAEEAGPEPVRAALFRAARALQSPEPAPVSSGAV